MHTHPRRQRDRKNSDAASSTTSNFSEGDNTYTNAITGPENSGAAATYITPLHQRPTHSPQGNPSDNFTPTNAPARMDALQEPIPANAHHDFGRSNEVDASRQSTIGAATVPFDHHHHSQFRTTSSSQPGAALPFHAHRTSQSILSRSTRLDSNLAHDSISIAPPLSAYNNGSGGRSSSSSTSGSAHGHSRPLYSGGQLSSYPLASSEQRPLPDTGAETIATPSIYPGPSMSMHSDSVGRGKPNAAAGSGFLANSVNVPLRNEQGMLNDQNNGDVNIMGSTATSTSSGVAVNLPHLNDLFKNPIDTSFPLTSLATGLNTHQLATDLDVTAHHLTGTGAAEEAVGPNYSDSSFQPQPPTEAQPPSQSRPQPSSFSPQHPESLFTPENSGETYEEMDERSRSRSLPHYYQGLNAQQQEGARMSTTPMYNPPPYPPHPHPQQQQPAQQPHHLPLTSQQYPQQYVERQSRQYVERSRSNTRSASHVVGHADPTWPNPSQGSAIQVHASGNGHRTHVRHQSHPSPYPRSNISNVARPSTSAYPPSAAQHGLPQWSPTMSSNSSSYPQSQPQQAQGGVVGPHRTIQRNRALSSPLYHHPAPAPYEPSPLQTSQYREEGYRGNPYTPRGAYEYDGNAYSQSGELSQPQRVQAPYANTRVPYPAEEALGAPSVGKGKKPKDPRPHKCTECGKGFPRPSALGTHMSVHSGEKPYRCPVVSCDKTFAVRSNARRHLKIHGIKLKTRDRNNSKKLDHGSTGKEVTSEDDLRRDYEDTGDEGDDAPFSPKSSLKATMASGSGPVSRRVDISKASAPHRGHTNTSSEGPLGFGAALSMLEFIPTATTAASSIAPSVKEVQVKRLARADRQWVLQSASSAASSKLRRQRESLSADRRRRGSRSEDQDLAATTTTTTMTRRASFTTTIKKVTAQAVDSAYEPSSDELADHEHEHDDDAEATGAEGDDDGEEGDAEADEMEGGEGVTLIGPSTTLSIPQLDREALDKLIAPPTAWEGFQKQLKMAQSGLSLDQRLQSHMSSVSNPTSRYDTVASSSSSYGKMPTNVPSGSYQSAGASSLEPYTNIQTQQHGTQTGPQEAFDPLRHGASLDFRREGSSNIMSHDTMRSTANVSYDLPSSDNVSPSYAVQSSSSATPGFNMAMPASSGFPLSGRETLSPEQQLWAAGSSAFLTSSVRTGASASLGQVDNTSNVSASATGNIDSVPGPSNASNNPTATTDNTAIGTDDLGTSMVGEWREDGTWIPRSMNRFQNINRLRNQPPFDDAGLDEPNVNVPLSAVQPRQTGISINGSEQSPHHFNHANSHQQYHGRHRHHPYQQQQLRPRHQLGYTYNNGITPSYSHTNTVGTYPYHPDYFNGHLPGPAPPPPSVPTHRSFPIAV